MNRREAIAALVALPATATITRAAVKPNDVIVLECDELISDETARRLRDHLKTVWPEHRCLVLSQGMRLRIATEGSV